MNSLDRSTWTRSGGKSYLTLDCDSSCDSRVGEWLLPTRPGGVAMLWEEPELPGSCGKERDGSLLSGASGSYETAHSSLSSEGDVCKICHCGGEEGEPPLITPCLCCGSLKFVHQECLQRWIKSSDIKRCELCKFPFMMQSKVKPFCEWERLDMSPLERRKLACSVTFHAVAVTCVVWSLYVLIDRTTEEIRTGELQWPFWTKLVVVAIGFTGGLVFMYIQCKVYLQLCRKWKAYNRIIVVQDLPPDIILQRQRAILEARKPGKEFDIEANQSLGGQEVGHPYEDGDEGDGGQGGRPPSAPPSYILSVGALSFPDAASSGHGGLLTSSEGWSAHTGLSHHTKMGGEEERRRATPSPQFQLLPPTNMAAAFETRTHAETQTRSPVRLALSTLGTDTGNQVGHTELSVQTISRLLEEMEGGLTSLPAFLLLPRPQGVELTRIEDGGLQKARLSLKEPLLICDLPGQQPHLVPLLACGPSMDHGNNYNNSMQNPLEPDTSLQSVPTQRIWAARGSPEDSLIQEAVNSDHSEADSMVVNAKELEPVIESASDEAWAPEMLIETQTFGEQIPPPLVLIKAHLQPLPILSQATETDSPLLSSDNEVFLNQTESSRRWSLPQLKSMPASAPVGCDSTSGQGTPTHADRDLCHKPTATRSDMAMEPVDRECEDSPSQEDLNLSICFSLSGEGVEPEVLAETDLYQDLSQLEVSGSQLGSPLHAPALLTVAECLSNDCQIANAASLASITSAPSSPVYIPSPLAPSAPSPPYCSPTFQTSTCRSTSPSESLSAVTVPSGQAACELLPSQTTPGTTKAVISNVAAIHNEAVNPNLAAIHNEAAYPEEAANQEAEESNITSNSLLSSPTGQLIHSSSLLPQLRRPMLPASSTEHHQFFQNTSGQESFSFPTDVPCEKDSTKMDSLGQFSEVAAFSRQISLLFEAAPQEHHSFGPHPSSGLGYRPPLPPINKPPCSQVSLSGSENDLQIEVDSEAASES